MNVAPSEPVTPPPKYRHRLVQKACKKGQAVALFAVRAKRELTSRSALFVVRNLVALIARSDRLWKLACRRVRLYVVYSYLRNHSESTAQLFQLVLKDQPIADFKNQYKATKIFLYCIGLYVRGETDDIERTIEVCRRLIRRYCK